jgi:hypothetical protein
MAAKPACAGSQTQLTDYLNNTLNNISPRLILSGRFRSTGGGFVMGAISRGMNAAKLAHHTSCPRRTR